MRVRRYDPRNGRRRTSVPKERRTIAVRSYGEDSGKEYRCWYCGWLCVVGRDSFGGAPHGAVYTKLGLDGVTSKGNPHNPIFGTPNTYSLDNRLPGKLTSILMKLDGSGDEVQINYVTSFSSVGCPGCGTMVWKW